MTDTRTTDDRQVCDYPICSRRGAGHPLACNCISASNESDDPTKPTTDLRPEERGTILMGINTLVGEAEHWACWYALHLPDNPHGPEWVKEARKRRLVRAKIMEVLQ